MYDKACYERRKNGIVKHCCKEEKEAYEKIKCKWGFSDLKIRKLLREFSVSEIFYGGYINGKFKPKDLFKLFSILIAIGLICFAVRYYPAEEMIISFFE